MISIVAVPYLSAGAWAAQREEGALQSIVVFPLDTGAAVNDAKVVSGVNALLRDGLSASSRYRAVAFSERLPAVQRLVSLEPDKKSAVQGPFASDQTAINRAVMLAKAMSADILVVGSVDKYQFSAGIGTADISGRVQLFDGRTGRALKEIPFQGHAIRPAGETGVSEAKIRDAAIDDAGRKLVKAITGEEYQGPRITIVKVEKSGKKSWIPALLISLAAGLLIGVLAAGSGSDSGGTVPASSDTELPPPPPVGF